MNDLVRVAGAQLVGSIQQTAAAAAAIFVAAASFVILTGTVTTQQLQVTQTVASNYRSTYDILVRPRGSAEQLEQSDGLVRPNFLSGSYGGIRLDQVRDISTVPGVEVAAPVAVLGQTMRNVLIPVDVGNVLEGKDHAMVRYALNGSARNGTANTSNQHGYLYLTRSPLTTIGACLPAAGQDGATSPAQSFLEQCWSARTGEGANPRVEILLSLPLTVGAIDPVAEAKLTGLDLAITTGRALTGGDAAATDRTGPAPLSVATAVMATELPFDFTATVTVDELSEATTDEVLATRDSAVRRDVVLAAQPVRTVVSLSRDAATTYRTGVVSAARSASDGQPDESLFVQSLVQPGEVAFAGTDPMRPRVVPFDPGAWRGDDTGAFVPTPTSVADTGYRPIAGRPRTDTSTFVAFNVVGTYDPERLPRPSQLNEVPLETYRSSTLLGADVPSRAVLGNQPLRSDLNPAGYVQSPPALLVSLKALPTFWKSFGGLDRKAPISSVRVRVAGITGLGDVDREKIRQVAQTIEARTGLQVDVTIGASLQNRQVTLPATPSGTPALNLNEQWTKKGVAVAISQALDVKSLVLFLVILLSSALTVALVSTATVAARRRELATLACLGWPYRRLGALLATELALIGLGAGFLAALMSWPMAGALGIAVTWWQGALAIPLGAALALVPGVVATSSASRTAPMDAFRPTASGQGSRSRIPFTGPAALGLIMTSSRWRRCVVGALAVALAVASALTLTTVVRTFKGTVVGSFLGDAVALEVRGSDIAAAAVLAVLGLVAVTTVLLLALLEDAPSFAALRAAGWSELALNSALMTQAATIGLSGALLGVGLALAGILLLIGPLTASILVMAVLAVVAAVAATTAVSVIPALLLSRLPTARILARE